MTLIPRGWGVVAEKTCNYQDSWSGSNPGCSETHVSLLRVVLASEDALVPGRCAGKYRGAAWTGTRSDGREDAVMNQVDG